MSNLQNIFHFELRLFNNNNKYVATSNHFTYLDIRPSPDGDPSFQFTKSIADANNKARIPFFNVNLSLAMLFPCLPAPRNT